MKKQMIPLILALVVAGSVAASASIPGPKGRIHGCYTRSGGQLRVIGSTKACRRVETSLSWSVKGRTGARGAKGAPGAPGVPGTPGVAGSSGVDVTRVTASYNPAADSSSVASFTVPPVSIAHIYYRVVVTTPGGSCVTSPAAHVGDFNFSLNGQALDSIGGYANLDPGQSEDLPHLNSLGDGVLLPGQYQLTTEPSGQDTTTAPDCTGTVVQTEVFVETEPGA